MQNKVVWVEKIVKITAIVFLVLFSMFAFDASISHVPGTVNIDYYVIFTVPDKINI
jgi:hypothetical protein